MSKKMSLLSVFRTPLVTGFIRIFRLVPTASRRLALSDSLATNPRPLFPGSLLTLTRRNLATRLRIVFHNSLTTGLCSVSRRSLATGIRGAFDDSRTTGTRSVSHDSFATRLRPVFPGSLLTVIHRNLTTRIRHVIHEGLTTAPRSVFHVSFATRLRSESHVSFATRLRPVFPGILLTLTRRNLSTRIRRVFHEGLTKGLCSVFRDSLATGIRSESHVSLATGIRSEFRVRPVRSTARLSAFLCCCFLAYLPGDLMAQSHEGYKLVWSDEFNKDGAPDPSNWSFEEGFVRNHEDQWYQAQNAQCKGGYLVIEARRESKPNPNFSEGSSDWKKSRRQAEYTSACMITRNKRQWLYGRWEMRARIDISKGCWPAWWALGVDKPWPSNGEIDMMEYYRGNLLANIAIGTNTAYKAYWYSKKKPVDSVWSSQFHIWRMDWDSTGIALYVDNQLLNKVPMDSLANRDGSGFNPARQPQYMLLNFAIGGDNGGDPAGTSFPRKFEVDYVRVYQRK